MAEAVTGTSPGPASPERADSNGAWGRADPSKVIVVWPDRDARDYTGDRDL